LTGTTPTEFPHQHKKERHEVYGKERGSQHATEHAGANGITTGCARAGGEH
jgi:hypothetical protein